MFFLFEGNALAQYTFVRYNLYRFNLRIEKEKENSRKPRLY